VPNPRERWQQMTPAQRGGFVTVASVDLALRAWSIADLARRPAGEVRGSKALWGLGLAVVNSAGALPLVYLLWGRRAAPAEGADLPTA
jgi:hypothetical protein